MTANADRALARLVRACGMSAAILALPAISQGAATIVIQNGNAAGVGFNDPTPAAPVGGNAGTTLRPAAAHRVPGARRASGARS